MFKYTKYIYFKFFLQINHCYYIGTVYGVEKSSVRINTCDGYLRYFVSSPVFYFKNIIYKKNIHYKN